MTTLFDFSEWLKNELSLRNMKPADLAKKSKVSKAIISRLLSAERMPRPETLVQIAEGLGITAAKMFEEAGYLPKADKKSNEIEDLVFNFSKLSEEDKQDILELMRFKQEKRSRLKTNDQNKRTSRGKNPARSTIEQ
jgi:transcriptional regulator with XRE-family HTH domain